MLNTPKGYYFYQALHPSGHKTYGSLWAADRISMVNTLQQQGLEVILAWRQPRWISFSQPKVTWESLQHFALEMEMLDTAGLPLVEALDHAANSTTSIGLKKILYDVKHQVETGIVFSEACQCHSQVFNPLMIGFLKIGESTGNLRTAFSHLKEYLQREAKLKEDVGQALRYPLFLTTVVIGLIWILLVSLVPELKVFLGSTGQELPYHAQILIDLSDILSASSAALLSGGVGLVLGCLVLYHSFPNLKASFKDALRKLPIIHSLILYNNLARCGCFLSLLLRSGHDLVSSLSKTADLMTGNDLKNSLLQIRQLVEEGCSCSKAFAHDGQWPPLFIEMLKLGERTGELPRTLEHAGTYYEAALQRQTERFISFIQPALVLLLGSFLAWIVSAIFMPLYEQIDIFNRFS